MDDDPPKPNEVVPPLEMDDATLLERLAIYQGRARNILSDYNIGTGDMSVIARRADILIQDTGTRADLLLHLICLQEFGAEAKRRGILEEATRPTERAESEDAPGQDAPGNQAPAEEASTLKPPQKDPETGEAPSVDDEATKALFEKLDRQ